MCELIKYGFLLLIVGIISFLIAGSLTADVISAVILSGVLIVLLTLSSCGERK